MDEGRIKWFDPDRRYGFIERGGGKDDVFLHISKWKGSGTPQERQQVTFDLEKTPKGRPGGQREAGQGEAEGARRLPQSL